MATLDPCVTIEMTRRLTRDEALKIRECKRTELRIWEDAYGLPRSFETKAERTQREIEERRLTHHE